jgi:hypothetical protein
MKHSDLDLENPEYQEQDEYRVRRSRNECTCDLLTPFGHVTCSACNEMTPEDQADLLEIELQLEYGW